MVDVNNLEKLGLEAVKEFWGLDNGVVDMMSSKQVNVLTQKARLGMQFYREINIGKRANERNTLRVCTMIAGDTVELKQLLKASLPQYYASTK